MGDSCMSELPSFCLFMVYFRVFGGAVEREGVGGSPRVGRVIDLQRSVSFLVSCPKHRHEMMLDRLLFADTSPGLESFVRYRQGVVYIGT
jgi:hypothetical protein